MVKHSCCAQWIARGGDFLGIHARAGAANQRFIGWSRALRPGNYGPGVGTCLEYEKISIVIVDDPLPADGRSLIINTSCQSTMQSCVAERAIGIRRQSMLEKVNKQKLVVIGNGMAGIRTVEVLLDRAPDLYEITVFGSEPYGNYNRILLSPVLAGEKTVNDIMLNTEQWYEDNGITLRKGEMIEMIDRRTCEVVTEAGDRVPYDRLLIATGSNPIMLPLPGKDLPGVIGFRDIYDVNRMVEASTSRTHAVVIGGGLRGLEAANGP